MSLSRTRPALASLGALALSISALVAPAARADVKLGAAAPDFTLPAASDGKAVALKDLLAKNKAVVVIFIATKCPYSNGYNERMAAMAKEYAAKGIAFVGVNSNKAELAPEVAEHAKKHGFSFPVVKDDKNKVADAYDAQKTPEVYVLDSKGALLYRGRIDETHDEPNAVKSPDLRNALDAILGGKPVPKAETKAFGCTIKRV